MHMLPNLFAFFANYLRFNHLIFMENWTSMKVIPNNGKELNFKNSITAKIFISDSYPNYMEWNPCNCPLWIKHITQHIFRLLNPFEIIIIYETVHALESISKVAIRFSHGILAIQFTSNDCPTAVNSPWRKCEVRFESR